MNRRKTATQSAITVFGIPAIVSACIAAAGVANAQTWPDHPIHMIVPFSTAAAVDASVRVVAQKMGSDFGQQIVVENQAGASGLIGMRAGARAKPDGYTIVAVNDSVMAILPSMKDDVGYNPITDFAPITQLVALNFVLVAHPSFAASSVKELINLAKKKPGTIDYASGGPGSPQHIAMELFMHATGTKLNHVPFRGSSQAFTDVVGGQIPLEIVGLPLAKEFIASGKLKVLAITSTGRSKVLPDTPTIAEQGVPGFYFTDRVALVAPAHTPSEIVARLNQAAVTATRDPAVARRLDDLGFEVIANKPEAFAVSLKQEIARYRELSREAHIHLD
jgi:tripartite-type tricarboxylate transporter receptor subunit TctC